LESQWPENFDFVALDVETANKDFASICQVGLAFFCNGQCIAVWQTHVDPQTAFSPNNIAIHGLDASAVAQSPRIPAVLDLLRAKLSGRIVVHHSPFDKTALKQAARRFNQPELDFQWLDTVTVAKKVWPDHPGGYGLSNLAASLSIPFDHHDAAQDARATGQILAQALAISPISLKEWIQSSTRKKPAYPGRYPRKIELPGHPGAPLNGQVIVFTGQLSIPREQAAQWAAKAGCVVADRVTSATTLLVQGAPRSARPPGQQSAKLRTAHERIAKGQNLTILDEPAFTALMQKHAPLSRSTPTPPPRGRPTGCGLAVVIFVILAILCCIVGLIDSRFQSMLIAPGGGMAIVLINSIGIC